MAKPNYSFEKRRKDLAKKKKKEEKRRRKQGISGDQSPEAPVSPAEGEGEGGAEDPQV